MGDFIRCPNCNRTLGAEADSQTIEFKKGNKLGERFGWRFPDWGQATCKCGFVGVYSLKEGWVSSDGYIENWSLFRNLD
jgi:hypothetical protein